MNSGNGNGVNGNEVNGNGNGGQAVAQYVFHQGMDSGGNDIKQKASIVNDIDLLKEWCTACPQCKGFNTNAWMKHTISPETSWHNWTDDPNKGLYVKYYS